MAKPTTSLKPMTLQRLAARPCVEIAVDTEFKDAHTLTVQAAARLSAGRIVVQVYRSPEIPPPPEGFDRARLCRPIPAGTVATSPDWRPGRPGSSRPTSRRPGS